MLLESWPGCLFAWLAVCTESNLETVGAWMQSSHQSLLTCLCDGLPDITAAVISGGRTTPLLTWIRSSKALCVNGRMLTVEMFCQNVFFFLFCMMCPEGFHMQRQLDMQPNTGPFAQNFCIHTDLPSVLTSLKLIERNSHLKPAISQIKNETVL